MSESIYVNWGEFTSEKDKMLRDALKDVFNSDDVNILLKLSEFGKNHLAEILSESGRHVNRKLLKF